MNELQKQTCVAVLFEGQHILKDSRRVYENVYTSHQHGVMCSSKIANIFIRPRLRIVPLSSPGDCGDRDSGSGRGSNFGDLS